MDTRYNQNLNHLDPLTFSYTINVPAAFFSLMNWMAYSTLCWIISGIERMSQVPMWILLDLI